MGSAPRARTLSHRARLAIALFLLVGCMFVASRFGLVALIANGYRALAYIVLAIYVAAAADHRHPGLCGGHPTPPAHRMGI